MIYGTVRIFRRFDVNRRSEPLNVENRIGGTEGGRSHDLKRGNGHDADSAQVPVARLPEKQGAAFGV